MTDKAISDADLAYQLRKLYLKYGETFAFYQWPSEHQRWTELLFALATQLCDQHEDRLRDAIDLLDDLGLLDVDVLASIPLANSGIDLQSEAARRIGELLRESGLSEVQTKECVRAFHDAAVSLKQLHDGKIQRYLRHYANQILQELPQHFRFTGENEAAFRNAFTYWLQNVLNVPLNFDTTNVKEFRDKFGVSTDQLVKTADELDLNIALVDDLIDLYIDESKPDTVERS